MEPSDSNNAAPSLEDLEKNAEYNLNQQLDKMQKESDKKVLGNLTSRNVIEYFFLIIIVATILAVFASL